MLKEVIKRKLAHAIQAKLYRQPRIISHKKNNLVQLDNQQTVINFSSNDYLGIANQFTPDRTYPKILEDYGFGSTASAHICGYSKLQQQFEYQMAEFLEREAAILFNSGYLANMGIVSVLADHDTHIIADKYVHASIIDGIRISQTKKFLRYKHQDLQHLNWQLAQIEHPNKLIITESIFSMEGNITDLTQLVKIAKKHAATLFVDDAHAFGLLGESGQGLPYTLQLKQNDIDILLSPLGKAFGGVGAIVSGEAIWIDAIRQFARTNIYTTAMPPIVIAMLRHALQILKTENWRRTKLHELINYFNQQAKQLALPFNLEANTPIKILVTVENQTALFFQKYLLDKGFLIGAIRPPTVPNNTARIRINLNCLHTEREIKELLTHIAEIYHNADEKYSMHIKCDPLKSEMS